MEWTVARFPNGEWTTGGAPTDRDYAECEIFVVDARSRCEAKKKAQQERRRVAYSPILGAAHRALNGLKP